MTTASAPRRRRLALVVAAALIVGLPLTAFLLAPTAVAQLRPDSASAGPPGSQLAGINASSVGTGIQVAPLTPGIVGAGNVVQGNLIEASMPYASSTVSTGPSTGGVASPAYPGPTAADAGTAIETFAPTFPQQLANLLNDPVLAQSASPPQVHTGTSGAFRAPGASLLGIGTASTDSSPAGTTATATLSDSSSLGSLLAGLPLIAVASGTSSTSGTVKAASVTTTAHSVLGRISIAGIVDIAGISSDASASSDGTIGQVTKDLRIGAVTVLGQPAYIGPDGIHLSGADQGGLLVPVLNQALQALQQAGLTVKTVAPTEQQSGPSASISSGALQISFIDKNIPNPQGRLPIGSSVGLNVDLGLSQAAANATVLPPFAPVPGGPVVAPPIAPTAGTPAIPGEAITGNPSATPAAAVGAAAGPEFGSTPAIAGSGAGAQAPSAAPASAPALIGFLGLPVRVAWIVLAFLLSIVAAGPLLAYANWQLLRGRTS